MMFVGGGHHLGHTQHAMRTRARLHWGGHSIYAKHASREADLGANNASQRRREGGRKYGHRIYPGTICFPLPVLVMRIRQGSLLPIRCVFVGRLCNQPASQPAKRLFLPAANPRAHCHVRPPTRPPTPRKSWKCDDSVAFPYPRHSPWPASRFCLFSPLGDSGIEISSLAAATRRGCPEGNHGNRGTVPTAPHRHRHRLPE